MRLGKWFSVWGDFATISLERLAIKTSEHNHKVLSSEQKDLLTSYMQQLINHVNMSEAPKLKSEALETHGT